VGWTADDPRRQIGKGAEKLGHYVEHDLRRVLSSHVVPVALPGPEEQSTAKDAAVGRPAIGPVVPLSAIGGGEGGDLSGAASHPVEREADALATRVLNRGDAIVAPTRYEFEETEVRDPSWIAMKRSKVKAPKARVTDRVAFERCPCR
jgi:hypothetical protein